MIFRPIDQVGWAGLGWGVTRSKVSRARVRNGPGSGEDQPPDLVRTAPVQALVQRAVLAVDGRSRPPWARAWATISSPARPAFLVGGATSCPPAGRDTRHQAHRSHAEATTTRHSGGSPPPPRRPAPPAGGWSRVRAGARARRAPRSSGPRRPAGDSGPPARRASHVVALGEADDLNRPGNASTIRSTFVPTDPVDPRMARPFKWRASEAETAPVRGVQAID